MENFGTQVQFDASAHLLASQMIRESGGQTGLSQLLQLEEYIQAIVLYDYVVIPVERPDESQRIQTAAPPLLWQEGGLRSEVVQDLRDRQNRVEKEWLERSTILCAQRRDNPSLDAQTTKGTILREMAWTILRSNQGWAREFQNHLPNVFLLPGTNEILSKKLAGPEYAQVSDEDKIAIWYLLRTSCFVSLAAERNRPHKHNYYRTPFAEETYSLIRASLLERPGLEEFAPDFHKINAAKLMDDQGCRKWQRMAPLFLSHILDHIDKPGQIEAEILELRNSSAARRFREYHREIIEKYDPEQAAAIVDADVERLLFAWHSIGSPVEIPVTIDLPMWFQKIPGRLAWDIRKIWYRVRNHPLRIFMDILDDDAKYSLIRNAKKVFGDVHR